MNTLPLAPLPSETSEQSNEYRRIRSEGFIDEQAVSGVIARGAYDRNNALPAGIALPASGDDYAGWMLPVMSPFRQMSERRKIAMTAHREAAPPALRKVAEPGIDSAYLGGHRWWLFGMSGAMTCGVMALTIFSLVQRHGGAGSMSAPVTAADRHELPAAVENPAFQPSLTTVLPAER